MERLLLIHLRTEAYAVLHESQAAGALLLARARAYVIGRFIESACQGGERDGN